MTDTENRDQYVAQYIEQLEEGEDIKPPIDVTPPIDQSPNISATGEPELLPEPEKPAEKKGLFGKKAEGKKEKKEKPPKKKKEKKEKSGVDSGDEGAANKLKGLFKKNKKQDTTAIEINDHVEGDTETLQTSIVGSPTHPSAYSGYPGFQGNQVPSYPSGTTSAYTGPKSVSAYLHRPAPNNHKEGCAEVKASPKKSVFRCSNFINVLLILGCIAGVIMTAAAGDNTALTVVGPFFIGISLFALVGKIFFTLFWTREAHPMLKPAAKAINMKMKTGPNYQQQQYAMNTYNYPRSSAYNQAYDTTPQGPPPPLSLTAPGEYMSEDDFTPYNPPLDYPPNYHEEPVPDNYRYDTDGQYPMDIKEEDDMKKEYDEDLHRDYDDVDIQKGFDANENKKDFDEGGGPRFI